MSNAVFQRAVHIFALFLTHVTTKQWDNLQWERVAAVWIAVKFEGWSGEEALFNANEFLRRVHTWHSKLRPPANTTIAGGHKQLVNAEKWVLKTTGYEIASVLSGSLLQALLHAIGVQEGSSQHTKTEQCLARCVCALDIAIESPVVVALGVLLLHNSANDIIQGMDCLHPALQRLQETPMFIKDEHH